MRSIEPEIGAVEMFTGKTLPEHGPDRFLIIAIDLFYKKGFAATTLEDILAEAGATLDEFHEHFRSYDDLQVQSVRQHDTWERESWVRAVEEIAGHDPAKQLLAIWDVMDELFENPAYHGCLYINAAGEFPDPTHPVHRAAVSHKRQSSKWFRSLAIRAGIYNVDQFAYEYTTLFEGTLILRQLHHDPDAVRMTRPMIERLIQNHLSGSSKDKDPASN